MSSEKKYCIYCDSEHAGSNCSNQLKEMYARKIDEQHRVLEMISIENQKLREAIGECRSFIWLLHSHKNHPCECQWCKIITAIDESLNNNKQGE